MAIGIHPRPVWAVRLVCAGRQVSVRTFPSVCGPVAPCTFTWLSTSPMWMHRLPSDVDRNAPLPRHLPCVLPKGLLTQSRLSLNKKRWKLYVSPTSHSCSFWARPVFSRGLDKVENSSLFPSESLSLDQSCWELGPDVLMWLLLLLST